MKTKDKPQAKQYVIYSRKSKFTGKGESIENQIELCRQYIAMHFGEDAAEHALVYEDEGFSGGNLAKIATPAPSARDLSTTLPAF